MKDFKVTLTLFFLLIGALKLIAGHEVTTALKKGEEIKNGKLVVADQFFGKAGDFRLNNQSVNLKLYHTDILKIPSNNGWTLDVGYSLLLKFPDGSSRSESGSLAIDGDPGDNLLDTNISSRNFPGATYASLTVTSVDYKDGAGAVIDTLPDDFHLEVSVMLERYYEIASDTVPAITKIAYASGDNSLNVSWDYIPGAEEYELEYLFIADGSPNGDDHTDTAISYNFQNATRISLNDNFYSISMAYPKGSLILRVRGVGFDFTQGEFWKTRVYTAWSYDPSTTTILQASSDNSATSCLYYFPGISAAQNWTYTSTYAEDGKRKEVASFFDGSGRSRQQVTINNTNGFAIVGETKYDFVGRPAVNILPAPTLNQGMGFYGDATTPFNGAWNRDNFATDNHLNENNDTLPEALPASSEARNYYSSSNNLDFINKEALPDAEAYPYTMTHFLNDGTDRPHIQTGPGGTLRYKAQNSHNTKYYYGTPTQSDVDRLFGSEAGYHNFYRKNITIDPNGQQSVQYLDAKGRVVATALAGENPNNLDTIGDKSASIISSPILNGPKTVGGSTTLVESMEYTSTSLDDVYIGYDLSWWWPVTCTQATPTTATESNIAAYDIILKVENSRGELVADTSLTAVENLSDPDLLRFSPGFGDYKITRSISLNQQVKNDFMQRESDTVEYAKNFHCDIRYGSTSNLSCDTLNCDSACYHSISYVVGGIRYYTDTAGNIYEADPSNPHQYFVSSDSLPSLGYHQGPVGDAYADCKDRCEGYKDTTGAYDVYRFQAEDRCQMKADMLAFDLGPEGSIYSDGCSQQYCYQFGASPQLIDGHVDTIYAWWSSDSTLLPDTLYLFDYTIENATICFDRYIGDSISVESSSYYTISDLNRSVHDPAFYNYEETFCDSTSTFFTTANLSVSNQLLGTSYASWGELYANWQASYAQALLQLHPEYCAYDYFCNYSESCSSGTRTMCEINEFAGVMYLPPTYSDAIDFDENTHDYNVMNPLLLTPTGTSGGITNDQASYMQSGGAVFDPDPLVSCNSSDTTTLTGYANAKLTEMLQNFMPIVDASGNVVEISPGQPAYYSLWYVLDDPHGIADVNANNYYSQLDSSIIQIFNSFHGDGDCLAGVITSNDDKLLYFRSIYLFMREKVIYDYFDKQYMCTNTSPPSYYTYWDADTNMDGTLDDGSGIRLNYPKNPLYAFYGQPHMQDSLVQKVQQQTAGNTQNLATSRIDTLSCSKFLKYLDDKGYDTTLISVPYANSSAIAAHLKADFCTLYSAELVDSILLCATGVNYVYTNHLPDTLRVSFGSLLLQQAQESCADRLMRLKEEEIKAKWEADKADYLDSLSAAYDREAFAGLEDREDITLSYSLGEYHYALYYYDQADNLVKTVPPSGVDVLNSSQLTSVQSYRKDTLTGAFVRPDHTYITNYRYNTQNQIAEQRTPDGGVTYFWYDNLARLVVSQNARQLNNNQYSYSIYDGQGRVAEAGQVTQTNAPTSDTTRSPEDFKKWLLGGKRDQVTFTLYDRSLSGVPGTGKDQEKIDTSFGSRGQQYLRNRVASSFYVPEIPAGQLYVFNNNVAASIPSDYLAYQNATHYSYDPHGNVSTLVQEFDDPVLENVDRRFVRVDYEYDLVSGNVNQVSYQAGRTDEFYHRYEYDADNRITEVFTSRDGINWEKDAGYHYYPHGPLSRTEIGDMNIQGLDYVYNLQGWLKTVNSTSLGESKALGTYDLGSDGRENHDLNQVFAADAYGFGLDYFDGDYMATGNDDFMADISGAGNSLNTNQRNLYNGNISRMITAVNDNNQHPTDVMANTYHYDQLNRITAYNGYSEDALNEDNSSSVAGSAGYGAGYFYDPNGNIQTLQRYNAAGNTMDSLDYHYDVSGSYKKNQLLYVDDFAGVTDTVDLADQSPNNYSYDAIGNLTSDVSEGITNIEWNLQGKTSKIAKSNGDTIRFRYDPMGNRIMKQVESFGSTTTTYYMRDASGNTLATYRHDGSTLKLLEQSIFGSDRLGVVNKDLTISSDVSTVGSPLNLFLWNWEKYAFYPDAINTFNFYAFGSEYVVIFQPEEDILLDTNSVSPMGGDYEVVSSTYKVPAFGSIMFSSDTLVHFLPSKPFKVTAMSTGENVVLNGYRGSYTHQGPSSNRVIGKKSYELKNHLDNVLATVSDRKVWSQLSGITSTLLNQSFSDSDHESSSYANLKDWKIVRGEVAIEYDTDLTVSTEERDAVITRHIDGNCYSEYCITLENITEPLYVSIISDQGGTYIVNNQYVDPTEGVELCWDISQYGGSGFSVEITFSGSFVITKEMLTSPSLPAGWSAVTSPSINCFDLNASGLEITYNEDGNSAVKTGIGVTGSCDQKVCFFVPGITGSGGLLTIKDGQNTTLDTTAISYEGTYCIDLSSGSYDSLVLIFEAYEGSSITLMNVEVEDICSIYTQVADVLSMQDYYPFGMIMPGRKFQSDYRYGFNGMEQDEEIKNHDGSSLEFGSRAIYDGRIGRFVSVDPRWRDFNYMSPYTFAANSPIINIDQDGEGPITKTLAWLARQTNSVITIGISSEMKLGALLSAGGALGAYFAADPHGNYAIVVSGGAFASGISDGYSTSDEVPGAANGGSFYVGADAGVSLDGAMRKGDYSSVFDLASTEKGIDFDGGVVDGTVINNNKSGDEIDGVELSGGAGAGAGAGRMTSESVIFAFNEDNLDNLSAIEERVEGYRTMLYEKYGQMTFSSRSIYYGENGEVSLDIVVYGADANGDYKEFRRFPTITFSQDEENPYVYKTDNVEE